LLSVLSRLVFFQIGWATMTEMATIKAWWAHEQVYET
jgi:hypothetical protein